MEYAEGIQLSKKKMLKWVIGKKIEHFPYSLHVLNQTSLVIWVCLKKKP